MTPKENPRDEEAESETSRNEQAAAAERCPAVQAEQLQHCRHLQACCQRQQRLRISPLVRKTHEKADE